MKTLSLLMILYFVLLTTTLALSLKANLKTENKCTKKGKYKANCGAGHHKCCNKQTDNCVFFYGKYNCVAGL